MNTPTEFDLSGLDPVARELVGLVLRIVGGDFGARAAVSGSGDGVAALTVALNMLAESFQREHEARARAEVLLADAVDSYELAPDAFCSCELRTLRVVKCNPALSRVLGRSSEELLHHSLFDFVLARARPAMEQTVETLLSSGVAPSVDVEFAGATGPFIASVTGAVKRDSTGAPLRLLFSLRDETQNRKLAEELVHAQRLDALARLAGGVAHDFNNLLLVIGASAELLGGRLKDHPDVQDELRVIRDSAERAAVLTRDLLAFARRENAAPTKVLLDDAVRSAEPLLTRLLGARTSLGLELAASGAGLLIGSGQISQILTNLVVNARDAMPEGGRITITTRVRNIEARDLVDQPDLVPGQYVELAVRDTGTGIPAELRSRIFEPFFTTKPTGRGTGLGLSIVYGIVRQARGMISVHEGSTGGTIFSLLFPLAGELVTEIPPTTSAPPGTRTLLVVEDDRLVRTLTSRVLRGAGYEVIEASGGEEALAHMKLRASEIALVVSDVVMPGVDGIAVLESLRNLRPDVPCLFVTGYAREESRIRALPRVNLLYKPFVPSSLIGAVQAMIIASEAAPSPR